MISKNLPFVLASLILLSCCVTSKCTVSVKFTHQPNSTRMIAVISDKAENLDSNLFNNPANTSNNNSPVLRVEGTVNQTLDPFDIDDVILVNKTDQNVFEGVEQRKLEKGGSYVISQRIGFHDCTFAETGNAFANRLAEDKTIRLIEKLLLNSQHVLL